MARPTKRSEKLVGEVVSRLSGGEPLAKICRDEHMPDPSTWRDWCDKDQSLAIAYARAREDGFDAIALDALDIADDASGDVRVVGEDEREVCNTEFVQRSRLRVETRLKLLAKWDPKRYGERIDHTSSDGSMSPPKTLADFYGERPGDK